jgi:hypothetical protein
MQVLPLGDHVDIAGFGVEVVRGPPRTGASGTPGPATLAFLIDDRILVTGDEHPAVDMLEEVLITPVDAPWLRAVDLIHYLRLSDPGLRGFTPSRRKIDLGNGALTSRERHAGWWGLLSSKPPAG